MDIDVRLSELTMIMELSKIACEKAKTIQAYSNNPIAFAEHMAKIKRQVEQCLRLHQACYNLASTSKYEAVADLAPTIKKSIEMTEVTWNMLNSLEG